MTTRLRLVPVLLPRGDPGCLRHRQPSGPSAPGRDLVRHRDHRWTERPGRALRGLQRTSGRKLLRWRLRPVERDPHRQRRAHGDLRRVRRRGPPLPEAGCRRRRRHVDGHVRRNQPGEPSDPEGSRRSTTSIPSVANEILGQAYGLRALHYFNLVRSWGDVPLVLVPPASLDEAAQVTRAPLAQVYAPDRGGPGPGPDPSGGNGE